MSAGVYINKKFKQVYDFLRYWFGEHPAALLKAWLKYWGYW